MKPRFDQTEPTVGSPPGLGDPERDPPRGAAVPVKGPVIPPPPSQVARARRGPSGAPWLLLALAVGAAAGAAAYQFVGEVAYAFDVWLAMLRL